MGSLSLPEAGPVYLDANGFIYSVERLEPYAELLDPLWAAAREQRFEIVCSELVILETLVKPLRQGDEKLCDLLKSLLYDSEEVRLLPTTRATWESAADLRARLELETPDAIHAASALTSGSTMFVTNDNDFRELAGLPVTIMSDLVQ